IKIVKQKRDESAAPAASENKTTAPSTSQIASTIKNWIAESKERKQNQRRSFPVLTIAIVISFVLVALGTPSRNTKRARVSQSPNSVTQSVTQTALETADRPLTAEERAIKVTIASVSSFLGPPTNRYRVGDQIPITITMTNTSPATIYTCLSSDLYQDVPQLT